MEKNPLKQSKCLTSVLITPSREIVEWFTDYKRSRTITDYAERSSCPNSTAGLENIKSSLNGYDRSWIEVALDIWHLHYIRTECILHSACTFVYEKVLLEMGLLTAV